jgi:hypothetical protein
MARICQECQNGKPDTSMRGSCQAPNHVATVSLPPGHVPWTDSFQFSLCDECAEHFGQCAWCRGSLYGVAPQLVPTRKRFCQQFDEDSGSHVEGMNVGEQIMVKLTIDLYSGISWGVKSASPGVFLGSQRTITEGGQFGFLELYFDLSRVDPTAKIELVQVATRSWVMLKNPQTWQVTVEVQH